MIRERPGHAQRQPGVAVGAVGVAQVLAWLAVADHRVPVAGERRVERVLGALGDVRDAPALGQRDDQDAVVGADGAERLTARERAAELVQREAQARTLGRPELRVLIAGAAQREHADRRRRRPARPPSRVRGPPPRAAARVVAQQGFEQPHLELPLRPL